MLLDFNDCAYEGTPDPGSERRHASHPQTSLQARLFPDGRDDAQSDELEVIALNLTRHGVGLEIAQDLAIGNVYSVEIGVGGQHLQSHVRITSCDPIAEGLYRAGGEFC